MVVVVLDRLITHYTVANHFLHTRCCAHACNGAAARGGTSRLDAKLRRPGTCKSRAQAIRLRCRTVLQCNLMLMPEPETRELYEELRFLLAGGIEIRRSSGTAFAVFQRPTRSIECAMAIGKRLKPFDLKARAAIHVLANARCAATIFPALPSMSRRAC